MSSYRYSAVLVGETTQVKLIARSSTPATTFARVPIKLFSRTIPLARTIAKNAEGKRFERWLTPATEVLRTANLNPFVRSITQTTEFSKLWSRYVTRSVAPATTVVKQGTKVLDAAVIPSATVLKRGTARFTRSLSPATTFVRSSVKLLSGSLTPTGSVLRTGGKNLAASLTPGPGTQGIRAMTKKLAASLQPLTILFRSGLFREYGPPGSVSVTVRAATETRVNVYQRHRVSIAVFEHDDAVVTVHT